MARPIPVIAAVSDVLSLPGSMALDGSGSLDSLGAPGNIASYQWTLVEKPPGSAASLTAPTTATPTLTNIDIVGNYVVFLIVVDNLGASSFGYAYPRQHLPPEDLTTYDVPLYAFESPVAGAFVVVKAPYNNVAARLNQPIYKTGRKEFGWLVDAWNQADTVEDLREEMLELYDRPNLSVLADAVNPQTGGAGVAIDGLNIKDTGAITAVDSNRATIRVLDNFSVASNKNLQLEAGTGSLRADNIQSTTGGDITSASGMAIPEVITPLITGAPGINVQATANSAVTVTGAFGIDGSGTVTVESNSADLKLYGDSEVRVDSPGAFNVYANGGVFVDGGAGTVTLQTSDSVILQPTLWTESIKPVFAPGLTQAETMHVANPGTTAVAVTLADFTFSRQALGSRLTWAVTGQYLISAASRECDIVVRITPQGAAPQTFYVTSVGGAKTGGRFYAEGSVGVVDVFPVVATRVVDKDGASPVTVLEDLAGLSFVDMTSPILLEVRLAPKPANSWNSADCNMRMTVTCSAVNPHSEAVL